MKIYFISMGKVTKKKKKKNCSQVGSVGQNFLKIFFQVTKITQKHKNFEQSEDFCRKIFRKYFDFFSQILAKILRFLSKKGGFYKILTKLKEKTSPKMENVGRSCP